MFVDEFANWIWTNVLQPLTREGVQKAVKLTHKLAEHNNSTRRANKNE